jgi:hypothetical protein
MSMILVRWSECRQNVKAKHKATGLPWQLVSPPPPNVLGTSTTESVG